MHRDNLLLLESFFCVPEYRHSLATLIFNLNNQNPKEQTALLNQQVKALSSLLGVELQIDREAFVKLVRKERKVLLGRLRMLNNRVARKAG